MSIIKNPDYLHENYIPEQMWFRKDHLKVVAEAVKPLLSNSRAKNVLIHGPSGSGKTSSSKYFLRYLNSEELQVRTAYIDCWKNWTRYTLLKSIAERFGLKIISGKNTSSELLFRIENLAERKPCVLVLDEIDQLRDKWILYFLRNFGIAVILISVSERLVFQLNEKVRSRLEPFERVHFPTYRADEIEAIVGIRAQYALKPHVLSKNQIRRIALNSGGNAHVALESLRLASSKADEDDLDKILDAHLNFALQQAPKQVKAKSLSRLNDHQWLLYKIIKEFKEIPSGVLHKKYLELVKEPMSERMIRNYLQKLVFYGFIRKRGSTRDRIYVMNK